MRGKNINALSLRKSSALMARIASAGELTAVAAISLAVGAVLTQENDAVTASEVALCVRLACQRAVDRAACFAVAALVADA